MIEIARGNLLKADADALVNTVNTEGVMGKGIALQFRNTFPRMYDAYVDACKHGLIKLGRMDVHELGTIGGGPRWIINFPTKGHWRSKSKLVDIKTGLDDLIATVERLGIRSIAVPPLGCGYGGLDWHDVRPLIERAFDRVPDVVVLLYEPGETPNPADMPNNTTKPTLTTTSATLLVLMHRYVQGLMDPLVTQLEAQKLMYFMQEAGEPLKLSFKAHHYGPYAPSLSHVLKRLDSHYLMGMGDGSTSPERALIPLAEGVDEARELLARRDQVSRRIDRVVRLIDGFEDSYGMEMLSSLHWVMVHDAAARASSAVAIDQVHAWNGRKRKTLKAAHLEKAWQRLVDQEWHYRTVSIEPQLVY